MNDGSLKTLFYPFETGILEGPVSAERVLFLNATPGFVLPEGFSSSVFLQQEFRPVFLALQETGHTVTPQPEGDGYDLVLVLAGRYRGQNEIMVAEALKRVRIGGRVVVAGGKTDGVASLRKRLSSILEIEGHTSKNHGVVFWLLRSPEMQSAIETLETANPPLILDGGFLTLPGIFSPEHIDPGSRLLVQNLPSDIRGNVADFGAGWGYLSVMLAQQQVQNLASITLFDASFTACIAARANMTNLAAPAECRVLWHDLVGEPLERRFDTIIMNPPFHQGRAGEPSLGEGMIRAASRALKPKGRLFLVANRQLPYEAVLEEMFSRSGETVRDKKFKILWAAR